MSKSSWIYWTSQVIFEFKFSICVSNAVLSKKRSKKQAKNCSSEPSCDLKVMMVNARSCPRNGTSIRNTDKGTHM